MEVVDAHGGRLTSRNTILSTSALLGATATLLVRCQSEMGEVCLRNYLWFL